MNEKYKKFIVPGIIVGVLLLIGLWIGGTYNSLVGEREKVTAAFSNVETQYQRRIDLVGNLVNTVKGSSDFEKSTLTEITEARAKAGSVKVDASSSQAQVQQYVEAQNQMNSALSRLLVTVEAYPNIKSTDAYRDLMSQLEGTENRIQVARSDFNNTARPYNTRIQTFPTNVIANLFGFSQRAYFESQEGADKAPTVDFSN
ncbi:MAG: LemA family protein [Acidobacteriota bacterium]